MNETQLKTKVLKYLRSFEGVWVWKVSDQFTAGIPDIIGCYKGVFFAIELKVGKNKPTRLQNKVLDMIRNSGGWGNVSYSLNDVIAFMHRIKQCEHLTNQ